VLCVLIGSLFNKRHIQELTCVIEPGCLYLYNNWRRASLRGKKAPQRRIKDQRVRGEKILNPGKEGDFKIEEAMGLHEAENSGLAAGGKFAELAADVMAARHNLREVSSWAAGIFVRATSADATEEDCNLAEFARLAVVGARTELLMEEAMQGGLQGYGSEQDDGNSVQSYGSVRHGGGTIEEGGVKADVADREADGTGVQQEVHDGEHESGAKDKLEAAAPKGEEDRPQDKSSVSSQTMHNIAVYPPSGGTVHMLHWGEGRETVAKLREDEGQLGKQKRRCFNCNKKGHFARDRKCKAQKHRCSFCAKWGHFSNTCWAKQKFLKRGSSSRKGEGVPVGEAEVLVHRLEARGRGHMHGGTQQVQRDGVSCKGESVSRGHGGRHTEDRGGAPPGRGQGVSRRGDFVPQVRGGGPASGGGGRGAEAQQTGLLRLRVDGGLRGSPAASRHLGQQQQAARAVGPGPPDKCLTAMQCRWPLSVEHLKEDLIYLQGRWGIT
jgi:hypothetical protein